MGRRHVKVLEDTEEAPGIFRRYDLPRFEPCHTLNHVDRMNDNHCGLLPTALPNSTSIKTELTLRTDLIESSELDLSAGVIEFCVRYSLLSRDCFFK